MEKPAYSRDRFFHWTKINVRFRDLDPLNHVNNAVFNSYFEEARIRFIQDVPEFKNSMASGYSFVLVHIEVDYIKPVLFEDRLLAGTSVASYGNSSIEGFQAIYSEENKELKAAAKTVGVWFDLKKNRPARLPEISNKEQYLYT